MIRLETIVAILFYNTLFMADLDAPCACGSGEPAGSCCMRNEECSCGSGNPAGQCCYAVKDEFDEDEGF